MSFITTERPPSEELSNSLIPMFWVWIDVCCGESDIPVWELNWLHGLPIGAALDMAADCRQRGFPATVTIEGDSPRPDGTVD